MENPSEPRSFSAPRAFWKQVDRRASRLGFEKASHYIVRACLEEMERGRRQHKKNKKHEQKI